MSVPSFDSCENTDIDTINKYEYAAQTNLPGMSQPLVTIEPSYAEKPNAHASGPIDRAFANRIQCSFEENDDIHLFTAVLVPALPNFRVLNAEVSYFREAAAANGLTGTCHYKGYIGPERIQLELTPVGTRTIIVIKGTLENRMPVKNSITGIGIWGAHV
ncbi:hypothetical protein ACEPAH_3160 [Sanghuangporus vaninii]